MLAIHESSTDRADRQSDFEGSLELLRELAVTTFERGQTDARLDALDGEMKHSRASDRTRAICLALAAWRANISRSNRSPGKRTIGFLGQAVKTP